MSMTVYVCTVHVDDEDVANIRVRDLPSQHEEGDELIVVRRYDHDKTVPPYYAAGICEQQCWTLQAAAYFELYDLCQVHDGIKHGDLFIFEHGEHSWHFELDRAWLIDKHGALAGAQPSAVCPTRLMQAKLERRFGGWSALEPAHHNGYATMRAWLDDEAVWANCTREEVYAGHDIEGTMRHRRIFKVDPNGTPAPYYLAAWEEPIGMEGGQS